MNKKQFLISLVLAISIMMVQVGGVLAAPAGQAFPPITGTVQVVTLEIDPSTGVTTVVVDIVSEAQAAQSAQEVRISQQTAEKLGLVVLDGDGKPIINKSALGQPIEIKLSMVIPDQKEGRHPVGNALEAFFSNIQGVNYGLIMEKHNEGLGFGVIAQALWLTRQIGGNSDDFLKFINSKQTDDYSAFSAYLLEDGTSPMNWGQLRKAILHAAKKNSSDATLSNQNENNSENNKEKGKDKDKGNDKQKGNNGNSNKP